MLPGYHVRLRCPRYKLTEVQAKLELILATFDAEVKKVTVIHTDYRAFTAQTRFDRLADLCQRQTPGIPPQVERHIHVYEV